MNGRAVLETSPGHPLVEGLGHFVGVTTSAQPTGFPSGSKCGQTTVNKKAPIHYIISINDMVYTDPSNNVSKNPPKFPR